MNKDLDHMSFTGRELEILKLLAVGTSNEKIAIALFLSINTVKTHISRIYDKLGVSNRTAAATKALAHNIVSPP